ncbi:MAG: aminoacyl-tRNA hydrolase [Castellaniella sp.]|uniref:aminoacyl-tRNA hydrolase n=1 Tax=Castellaniella sp. TaxID=1955812 RepID=UPI0012156142|nr:aminoacyl-tRNA hydrolase [Castellaniella sp.]TAN28935.1 MAG: aminoacyl-tRNA hydrolase [Castellaniella sp.]
MTAPIRLIVGLGNPGPEYEATRHNAGFWLADHFADDLHAAFLLEKPFFAWVARARHAGQGVVLAKPTTFMNKSGQAVGALARFYKLLPEEILVLHDELDLLPGAVKLKLGGGHAGHNGLRDIQSVLGTSKFWRLRIGTGHPRSLGLDQPVINFVLHPPRKQDMPGIDDVINRCRVVLPQLLDGEMDRATERLHQGNPHA